MSFHLARPAIARPVATTLLTIGLFLAGAIAFRALPVAPLPQVDFPTIVVTANLPGASPETMAATVATPLERALGTIAGVTELTSSSGTGSSRVTLQFDLNREIDDAARDVQAAINASRSTLPSSLPRNPSYRKVNPADQPIMLLSLTSDTYGRAQLYDAASTLLAQRISQVNGVGNVEVAGGAAPAVRVRVKMEALNRTGLSLDTLRTTIAAANAHAPTGLLDDGERTWLVATNDQAKTPDDYRQLVIQWANGAAVRLGDVAEVSQAQQDVYNLGLTNGKPSVQLQIFRQPGANIIETVEAVRALLPRLESTLPAAIDVQVALERTTTIRASLREVERALAISMGLVVLVVFLFLRSGRATLVPAVAVPVSLVSTFAAMYLLGYTLDNLSLMALTVATGFVVDDAVVVLENCMRHVERGMAPVRAVLRGTREVGFTVVSMSVSLVAVFIPILAMGGIVGRYFREFAVTLSVAIGISMLVSLTTTPMMCALLLRRRPPPGARPGERWPRLAAARRGLSRAVEGGFTRLAAGYARTLDSALRHGWVMLIVFFATLGGTVWLYIIVPKGFFPSQDVGLIAAGIGADQSMSFAATSDKVRRFMQIVQADPAVDTAMANVGGSRSSGGFMFIVLKPLAQRGGTSADAVIERLRPQFSQIAGAFMYMSPASDIRIGGRQSDAGIQFTLQSDDLALLRQWEPTVRAALSQLPELTDVNTDARDKGAQVTLNVDRDRLARLGLGMQDVDNSLNNAFGQRQISNIYAELNQYTVVMEADTQYLQGPQALQNITLVTPTGGTVPLSEVARWAPSQTALAVNRQGGFAASTISFNLADGVSLSQATVAVNQALGRAGVPGEIITSFQGGAKAFQDSFKSQPLLILAALVTIYIVLGILYESFVHPITILSTLPSAGVGAILALMAMDMEFTVIALIGVSLLMGIVKKNAIMMVDFAIEAERRGASPHEAIRAACLLRLRPILMTTMAALFGALPLALGTGDGAELRRPLGIAIVGGLIVSQWLTLYTTPVIYLVLDRLRLRVLGRRGHGKDAATPPPLALEPPR